MYVNVIGMIVKADVEKAVLEIRPYLQADGGDIELVAVDEDVVRVRLQGACVGCPMAQMTLRDGVERYLRSKVSGIKTVEAV
jgi:Fe-S cluster biogenesis protein NfuA